MPYSKLIDLTYKHLFLVIRKALSVLGVGIGFRRSLPFMAPRESGTTDIIVICYNQIIGKQIKFTFRKSGFYICFVDHFVLILKIYLIKKVMKIGCALSVDLG
jgi:hypothetical protein